MKFLTRLKSGICSQEFLKIFTLINPLDEPCMFSSIQGKTTVLFIQTFTLIFPLICNLSVCGSVVLEVIKTLAYALRVASLLMNY